MATKIWDAAAATPTGTHRIPADTSGAGSPTRYTVQQLADLYISTGVTAQALGNVTGATAISLAAGGLVTATATGNTTFSITNPPTAGSEWVLILTNGGAHTITWFTTTWAGATAPTLTASGVDVIHFATPDGGTTWYGWHETDFAVGTTSGTVAAGDHTHSSLQLAESGAVYTDATLSADGAWSGIHAEAGVLGETVSFGQVCYFKAADSRWWLADASSVTTSGDVRVGVCVVAGNAASATTILFVGNIRADTLFPTFTISGPLHISETAGAMTQTAPTTTDSVTRRIGFAHTADAADINVSNDYYTHV